MSNVTEGAKDLVQDVLATFSNPYGEDIILDVFRAIECHREWRSRYDALSEKLTVDVINQWIARYIKEEIGLNSLREVSVKGKCRLIKDYTKLGYA